MPTVSIIIISFNILPTSETYHYNCMWQLLRARLLF